jgi:hypothetical protein
MPIFYEWWQSFYGIKASECERCLSKFIFKKLLGQKNLGRGTKSGRKHMLKVGCHFASLRHLSKHCQNKVCKKNHYVWRISWIKKNHLSLLWQAKDNDITIVNS